MRKVIFVSFIVILLLGCSGRKISSPSAGTTPAPGTNPPSAGAVIEFVWDTLVPDLFASENHKYGFDKNPKSKYQPELAKDIYVSVKKGETAKVSLQLSNSFDKHSLFNVTTQQMVTNCCTNKATELELAEGHYEIYGDNVPLDRHIHVIGYNEKIVPAEYVQFDGEGGLCFDEGCYSFEGVKENFDRVYSQAVAKNAFVEKTASDVGLGDFWGFDLTEKLDSSYIIGFFAKVNDRIKKGFIDSRVILALNNPRVFWRLNKTHQGQVAEFNNFAEYFSAYYQEDFSIKAKSIMENCPGGVGSTPKDVDFRLTSYNNASNTFSGYLVYEGEYLSYNPSCDVFYIDNIRKIPGTSAAQIALKGATIDADGIDYNGIVLAFKQVGEASQNTILHEIGHTLGLTDLHIDYDDGTVPHTTDSVGNKIHENYTTTEANLMNYMLPTGPKLRYRDMFVVKTGNNDILLNPDGSKGVENQWDCTQNQNCYVEVE